MNSSSVKRFEQNAVRTAMLACEIKLSLGFVFVTFEVKVVGVMAGDGIALIGQPPLIP